MSARIWSRENAIAALRSYAHQLDRTPTGTDMLSVHRTCAHRQTYVELFGCIREAQLAAGLRPTRNGKQLVQKDVAIALLQKLAVELGRTPGAADMDATTTMPCRQTYCRIFGSVRAAQCAAGLIPNSRGNPKGSRRGWCRRSLHEMTPENTRVGKRYDRVGNVIGSYRHCRQCARERQHERELAARQGKPIKYVRSRLRVVRPDVAVRHSPHEMAKYWGLRVERAS